ncbi:MAG: hypothetical protein LC808_29220, partial [Actinobacteria bacterium]|nr:hypothetical protein [Actinomycetota bacterium]
MVALAALAATAIGGTGTAAAEPSGGGINNNTVYACVNKTSGFARLVDKAGKPLTSTSVCDAKTEYSTKISWN